MTKQPNPTHKKVSVLSDTKRKIYGTLADVYGLSTHLKAYFLSFYGELPWDSLTLNIRAWWDMGLLASILECYVHILSQIAEHLLTIRQWSYSKILIIFFSAVFWGRVLYFPLPPHLSASTLWLVYFVGCLVTYYLGEQLQRWVDGDLTLT